MNAHTYIKQFAPDLTDELVRSAQAGCPVATDGVIRATFPMLERIAGAMAYKQYPADAMRAEDLKDELISSGMESAWTLLAKTPEDTADGYGKHLRKTASAEMHGRMREVAGTNGDPNGIKSFHIAYRIAKAEDVAAVLDRDELVTVATDIACSELMDPRYRISRRKAEDMADIYRGHLSVDQENDSDTDDAETFANQLVSDLGNPEETLFGNQMGGDRAAEQMHAMYRAAARGALVRAYLIKMEKRSPRRAMTLRVAFGIDGHPQFESDADAAAYIESQGPEFEGITARKVQKDRSSALRAFEALWTKGEEVHGDEVSAFTFLAADLGLEGLI